MNFYKIISGAVCLACIATSATAPGAVPVSAIHLETPAVVNATVDADTEYMENGLVYRAFSQFGMTLVRNKSCTTDELVIPSHVEGIMVTSIGDEALYNGYQFRTITIPYTVTGIGNYAFAGCNELESVTIPDNVTGLGAGVFAFCSALKSITLPSNLTEISGSLFDSCESLTSVTIPEKVKTIGSYAFSGCSSLKNLIIPENVKTVKERIVEDCSSLGFVVFENPDCEIKGRLCGYDETVTICGYPGSTAQAYAEEYGAEFFAIDSENTPVSEYLQYELNDGEITITGCDSDAKGEIIIPEKIYGIPVTGIGIAAFAECSEITSITIPDTVTNIGYMAFAGTHLETITIPDGVKSIERAFIACGNLKSITLPKSVETIGGDTFYFCVSLESITIENPDCEIYDSEYTISDTAVIYGYPESTAQAYAEKYNRNFVALEQQQETTEPAPTEPEPTDPPLSPFSACLTFTPHKDYVEVFRCSKDANGLVVIPSQVDGLPVTTIGSAAFDGCKGVTQVTIPDSVTTLGDASFGMCSNLKTVNLPDSITSIDGWAFYSCASLESIVIPAGVTEIKDSTFGFCTSLQSITFKNPDCKISTNQYNINSSLTVYGYPGSTAEAYAESTGKKFVALEMPPETTAPDTSGDSEVSWGDANGDGVVDISDVVLMNRVCVGVDQITPEGLANADVDQSGKLELTDSMNVLRLLVHLVDESDFPIKS